MAPVFNECFEWFDIHWFVLLIHHFVRNALWWVRAKTCLRRFAVVFFALPPSKRSWGPPPFLVPKCINFFATYCHIRGLKRLRIPCYWPSPVQFCPLTTRTAISSYSKSVSSHRLGRRAASPDTGVLTVLTSEIIWQYNEIHSTDFELILKTSPHFNFRNSRLFVIFSNLICCL